tara:strand:+ start:247 stop:693 length:447 start_codon:yes stop_codon:yes gene_type:complete
MNETIARPVVAGKFWIVKDQGQKVGSLEKAKGGYVLRTPNGVTNYKTIGALRDIANISFENAQEKVINPEFQINGFETDAKPYNAVYNVQTRLPIYTKEPKSKSWHAAGWYEIVVNDKAVVEFCPKLILLERYPYRGPAMSADGFTFK